MTELNKAIKIIEHNHLSHFTYLPKKLGFDVLKVDGVTVINCRLKTSMFNIVYGSPKKTASLISQIKRDYNHQPFAWRIPPSEHDDNTTTLLIENGFVIDTIEHAMICDLSNITTFRQKTDLIIKVILGKSRIQDFISVLAPYDPNVSIFYDRMDDALLNKNEKLVVGYLDEKPVCIGILFISESSAGIFSLLTSEEYQGKGFGSDMMIFLMNYAKEHGCSSVTLSASSDAGYRIYERLGFIKLGEFECFEYKREQQ